MLQSSSMPLPLWALRPHMMGWAGPNEAGVTAEEAAPSLHFLELTTSLHACTREQLPWLYQPVPGLVQPAGMQRGGLEGGFTGRWRASEETGQGPPVPWRLMLLCRLSPSCVSLFIKPFTGEGGRVGFNLSFTHQMMKPSKETAMRFIHSSTPHISTSFLCERQQDEI